MRNRLILSVLLLFLIPVFSWAQFWKDYGDRDRQSIAEAYWLAGKQYQAVGQPDKGSQYMAMAMVIFPSLDTAAIKDQALPSAAELLAQGRATAIGSGASTVPTAAINSFFLRFVGALLDEDTPAVTGFLDGSVYLTKPGAEVTRDSFGSALDAFFQATPLQGMEASSVYDLDGLVVAPASEAMRTAWGETYTLSVTAKADYSSNVTFWEQNQRLYIHRVGGAWRIFAFGQSPPPLAWLPQKAAAVSLSAPQVSAEADASTAITAAFQAGMSAILAKDADTAMKAMSANVRFLRLRQTVTNDELKVSLLGYFDNADFGSATFGDVIDTDSIFVEPAQSPVDGVSGPIYALNVKARVDLSGSIPFWSTYQKYYFVKDDGAWLIFAIL